MSATSEAGARIATLDIVRGVAIMGILAMNIVAFAMPDAAYLNPLAYGTQGPADLASWTFSFLFIDGRMRGLFSFLFGASMLLVIDKAEAGGRNPALVHYARMGWLLVFGLIHFYLIWWGDILSLYAPVGMIAFAFRRRRPRTMIVWAGGLLLVQFALFVAIALWFRDMAAQAAAPHPSAATLAQWAEMKEGVGRYTPAQLAEILDRFRGSYGGIVHHTVTADLLDPIRGFLFFGWETLAYFLLGMAAFKTGFLTGAWSDERYRKVMLAGFGIGVPAYALLAWLQLRHDFAVPDIMAWGIAASVPFRPLMIGATAALVIVLTRRGGPLVERIAAAGRAAFTNYLGTSLLMTTLFYGYGLGWYGHLSRIQLWIPVVLAWAVMLLWSKPWLERFHYGPFEWLWRSLARWQLQPIRK